MLTDTNNLAIIDLGGQYCHLIARRLRDIGVDSHIYGPDVPTEVLSQHRGVILSGGPQSVYNQGAPSIDEGVLHLGVPVLGICYGHQLLAKMLGGEVAHREGEYGFAALEVRTSDTLFRDTPRAQQVWMSHSDAVIALPRGATSIAGTDRCRNAAFADFKRRLFGVQFHPEVVHTEYGKNILRNFARGVCRIRGRSTPSGRIPILIEQIRAAAQRRSIFFLVSGGVDSTVAFVLCARALPKERILGLYVDTGLMRQGETEELRANLGSLGLGDRLRVKEASALFAERLRGVTGPEEKRHIIGRLFVEIQSDAMREYGIDQQHWLLGQGTIYPDTIESGGANGRAAIIKTHHNRCEEIQELMRQGRVIEPLAEFYKDEVRSVGKALGLPPRLTNRWPFPGPGLAIRCICSRSSGKAQPLSSEAARTVEVAKYEGALLPIQSVGVQGDARTYRMVVALRNRSKRLDYRTLQSLTSLCNVHLETNRVVVLISSRPGVRLEQARICQRTIEAERVELLRQADFIVRSSMEKAGLTEKVWQFPVVLAPISFQGGETIILRPVNSEDGMTANFARLPVRFLRQIGDRIRRMSKVDAVFLDVTNKPPATIEWE
ncbi:MAG: glutamine-hydrolyzing GMP synthase [Deltaproteobacteria bacterium]|nr:glutamine-hydrolyzing GMP synthase [Deltaproteobacteria bacterium]